MWGDMSNLDGDGFIPVLFTGPAHGQLTLDIYCNLSYVPNAGFIGTDSFTYCATDGCGAISAPATMTITVAGIRATDDAYTAIAGQTLNITDVTQGVLANDTYAGGNTLMAQLVSGPANGQLTLNADGTFSYTPNDGFTGTDSFTYSATDGMITSAPATVTITVDGILARDDAYTLLLNQELFVHLDNSVLVNDSASDIQNCTTTLVSAPSNAQLFEFGDDGTFLYMPNYGFVGTDSFTYTASDGTYTSNVATVTITVESVQANDDVYVTPENTTLTMTAPTSTGTMDYCIFTAPNDSGFALGILLAANPNATFSGSPYAGKGDVTLAVVQELLAESNNRINTIIAWQVNVTPDAQTYAAAHGMRLLSARSLSICGTRWTRP